MSDRAHSLIAAILGAVVVAAFYGYLPGYTATPYLLHAAWCWRHKRGLLA